MSSPPSQPAAATVSDAWLQQNNTPAIQPADPWSPKTTGISNPEVMPRSQDPWSPTSQSSSTDLDEFDAITNRNRTTSPKTNGSHSDPFELNMLGDILSSPGPSPLTGATKKTPQSFLGENSALVNLDNLVTTSKRNLF